MRTVITRLEAFERNNKFALKARELFLKNKHATLVIFSSEDPLKCGWQRNTISQTIYYWKKHHNFSRHDETYFVIPHQ